MKDLKELRVYRLANEIAEHVWEEVIQWESFEKWTIGKQLTSSADGIAATMIEGYYRNSSKDTAKFFRYALSFAKEASLWWWRARQRNIIKSETNYEIVRKKLDDLLPQTVNFIKTLK